jgi:hypothetical protein
LATCFHGTYGMVLSLKIAPTLREKSVILVHTFSFEFIALLFKYSMHTDIPVL